MTCWKPLRWFPSLLFLHLQLVLVLVLLVPLSKSPMPRVGVPCSSPQFTHLPPGGGGERKRKEGRGKERGEQRRERRGGACGGRMRIIKKPVRSVGQRLTDATTGGMEWIISRCWRAGWLAWLLCSALFCTALLCLLCSARVVVDTSSIVLQLPPAPCPV
jgi:hypothetical protein